MDDFDSIFSRLVQTESRGRHRDEKGNLLRSPTGALGITQVLPSTGRNPGYGVAPLKDDTEAEYLRFGKDYLKAMKDAVGGDWAKALAAYNQGVGAVQKAVAIDPENWLDHVPEEGQAYVRKILGDGDYTAPNSGAAATFEDLIGLARGKAPVKAAKLKGAATVERLKAKAARTAPDANILPMGIGGPESGAAEAQAVEQENLRAKAAHDAKGLSVLEAARVGVLDAGIGYLIRKAAGSPTFTDVPGYVADPKLAQGISPDEGAYVLGAGSPDEAQWRRMQIDEHYDRRRQIQESGWAGLAGDVLAQLPEGFAIGAGASAILGRMGYGMVSLAAQGRRSAAYGSAIVENVGGNVLAEAAMGAVNPWDKEGSEYITAGAIGVLAGAVVGKLAIGATGRAVERAAAEGVVAREELIQQVRVLQAREALGQDASEADVLAKAAEIERDAVKRSLDARVPTDRKLWSDDDWDLYANAYEADLTPPEVGAPGSATAGMAVTEEAGKKAGSTGHGVTKENFAADWEQRIKHNENLHWHDGKARDKERWDRYDDLFNYPEWHSGVVHGSGGGLMNRQAIENLPRGVTISQKAAQNKAFVDVVKRLEPIIQKYIPEGRFHFHDGTDGNGFGAGLFDRKETGATISSLGESHIINVNTPHYTESQQLSNMIHEVGHAIVHQKLRKLNTAELAQLQAAYRRWVDLAREGKAVQAWTGRMSALNPFSAENRGLKNSDYAYNYDEWLAEGFAKHIAREIEAGNLPSHFRKMMLDLKHTFMQVFRAINQAFADKRWAAHMEIEPEVDAFFNRVMEDVVGPRLQPVTATPGAAPTPVPTPPPAGPAKPPRVKLSLPKVTRKTEAELTSEVRGNVNFQNQPTLAQIAAKYGIDNAPMGTNAAKVEQYMLARIYARAEQYAKPSKEAMSRVLSGPLRSVAPTVLKLMQSENPVTRMVAYELLENGSGILGRRTTASIGKHLMEQKLMGNFLNDFQNTYKLYRKSVGGSMLEDVFGGKVWRDFNKAVFEHIEAQRLGRASPNADPNVVRAAQIATERFDALRLAQIENKTPGAHNLPDSSVGYVPHRLDPKKIQTMSPDQERQLIGAYAYQFETIEGFDPEFSDKLAREYVDHVKKRASAGHATLWGVTNAEAGSIVADLMAAQRLTPQQAALFAKRLLKGAPAHTRTRLEIDPLEDFGGWNVADFMVTDIHQLLRTQVGRVSGEVALVQHGIQGSVGMKLLRRAMGDFGAGVGGKATDEELEAFDQVTAEFLNSPFGTARAPWMRRARTLNSLLSLGGMGFTQFSEHINVGLSLGARAAFSNVAGMRRLRSEIKTLVNGGQLPDSILHSFDTSGVQFGTEPYKMVFPFDNPDVVHGTVGLAAGGALDRALNIASHVQGSLSLWRPIHAAQERGVAEQIVLKSIGYIESGDSAHAKYLKDMGFSDQFVQAMRAEFRNPAVLRRGANGRVEHFDITAVSDPALINEYTQTVSRGVRQLIQGTFIGETGKWAHDDWLKLLTQFRTFSLISIDKQWGRLTNIHGGGWVGAMHAGALMMGAMSVAAPIYMSRVYVASLGRKDQEEYLEQRLSPTAIARATLNYVAMSGLSGDLLDALASVAGRQDVTGGRSGSTTTFVGNVVAPAAGTMDKLYGAIQNNREGTDVAGVLRATTPNLPYLIPVMNLLGDK